MQKANTSKTEFGHTITLEYIDNYTVLKTSH